MAFEHGSSTSLLVAEFDLSQYFNSVSADMSVATHDTTDYASGGAMERFSGLRDGTATANGLYEVAYDDDVAGWLGSAAGEAFTVTFGGGAAGDRARIGTVRHQSYNVSAPVGDMVAAQISLEGDKGIWGGVVLHALAALTSTTSTSSVDNAVSSANGAICAVHCTAHTAGGDTLDVVVEDSANDSTWATLGTFTQLTDVGSEVIHVTGTVDRYLRITATIAGSSPSMTFLVAVGRK